MSGKYSNAGWKKFEFPPDMITQEEGEKNMKLTKHQLQKMLKERVFTKVKAASYNGDRVSEEQWKSLLIRTEAKSIREKLNDEFIEDFIFWLQGRSPYNAEEFDRIVYSEDGDPIERETVPGTPWGSKPLFSVPGVSEFLDQGIDRRQRVITYLSKLKLRTPTNINEAYIYFKYLIRGVGLDDNACHEVASFAQFDNPIGPTGDATGPIGPAPSFFDEKIYKTNFRLNFDVAKNDPTVYLAWLMSGAPHKFFMSRGLITAFGVIDPGGIGELQKTIDAGLVIPYGAPDYYPINKSGTFLFGNVLDADDPTKANDAFVMDYYKLSPEDRDVMVATAYTFYAAAGGGGAKVGPEVAAEAGADRPAKGPEDVAAMREVFGAKKKETLVKRTEKTLEKVKDKAEKRKETVAKLKAKVRDLSATARPKDVTMLKRALDSEKRKVRLTGPPRGHTEEEAIVENFKDLAEIDELVTIKPRTRTTRTKAAEPSKRKPEWRKGEGREEKRRGERDPPLPKGWTWHPVTGLPVDDEGKMKNYFFRGKYAGSSKHLYSLLGTYNEELGTTVYPEPHELPSEPNAFRPGYGIEDMIKWQEMQELEEAEREKKMHAEKLKKVVRETGGPKKAEVIDLIEEIDDAPKEAVEALVEIIKETGPEGIIELEKTIPVEARKTTVLDYLTRTLKLNPYVMKKLRTPAFEKGPGPSFYMGTSESDKLLIGISRCLFDETIRDIDSFQNVLRESGLSTTHANDTAQNLYQFVAGSQQNEIDTAHTGLEMLIKARDATANAYTKVMDSRNFRGKEDLCTRLGTLFSYFEPEEEYLVDALHGAPGRDYGFTNAVLSMKHEFDATTGHYGNIQIQNDNKFNELSTNIAKWLTNHTEWTTARLRAEKVKNNPHILGMKAMIQNLHNFALKSNVDTYIARFPRSEERKKYKLTLHQYLQGHNPLSPVNSGKIRWLLQGRIEKPLKERKAIDLEVDIPPPPEEKAEEPIETPKTVIRTPTRRPTKKKKAPVVQLTPIIPSEREKQQKKVAAMSGYEILSKMKKELKKDPILGNPMNLPEDWTAAYKKYLGNINATVNLLPEGEEKRFLRSEAVMALISGASHPVHLMDVISAKGRPEKKLPPSFYTNNPTLARMHEIQGQIRIRRQRLNKKEFSSMEEAQKLQTELIGLEYAALPLFNTQHKEDKKAFRKRMAEEALRGAPAPPVVAPPVETPPAAPAEPEKMEVVEEEPPPPAAPTPVPDPDPPPVTVGPTVTAPPQEVEMLPAPELAELPRGVPRVTEVDSGPLGNMIRKLARVYAAPSSEDLYKKIQKEIVAGDQGIIPLDLYTISKFTPGVKTETPWTESYSIMKESHGIAADAGGGPLRVASAMQKAGFNVSDPNKAPGVGPGYVNPNTYTIQDPLKKYAALEAFNRYFAKRKGFNLMPELTGLGQDFFDTPFSELRESPTIDVMFSGVLTQALKLRPLVLDAEGEDTEEERKTRQMLQKDTWSQFYHLGVAAQLHKNIVDLGIIKEGTAFETVGDALRLAENFEMLFGDEGLLDEITGIDRYKDMFAVQMEAKAKDQFIKIVNRNAEAFNPMLEAPMIGYARRGLSNMPLKYGMMGLSTDLHQQAVYNIPGVESLIGGSPMDTSQELSAGPIKIGQTPGQMVGYTRRMDQSLVFAVLEGYWRAMEAIPAGEDELDTQGNVSPPGLERMRARGLYVSQLRDMRDMHLDKEFHTSAAQPEDPNSPTTPLGEYRRMLDEMSTEVATSVYNAIDAYTQLRTQGRGGGKLAELLPKMPAKPADMWNMTENKEVVIADALASLMVGGAALMQIGKVATPQNVALYMKAINSSTVFPEDIYLDRSIAGQVSYQPSVRSANDVGTTIPAIPFVAQALDTLYLQTRALNETESNALPLLPRVLNDRYSMVGLREAPGNLPGPVLDTLRGASREDDRSESTFPRWNEIRKSRGITKSQYF